MHFGSYVLETISYPICASIFQYTQNHPRNYGRYFSENGCNQFGCAIFHI